MNYLKDVEYAYAVAYIKTIENKMLTRTDIEALIAAENMAASRRILTDRGWIGDTVDELTKNELKRAWDAAYEVCDEQTPIDLLLWENDFHNLKTILKSKLAKADWAKMVLTPSTVEPQTISDSLTDGDFSLLPEFIAEVAEEAYKILTTTMDGQLMEIYVDREQQLALLKRAKTEKDDFIMGWAELMVKLNNMKTAWRCKKSSKSRGFTENALVPDNSLYTRLVEAVDVEAVKDVIKSVFDNADVTSLGSFERWCDNKRLAYVRGAKAECLSFRPIIAFLIGKSFEVQTVRIILFCKENGVGEEVIRERLRDMYV
ncbi:MAG: V-type ATPase subunit [Clostridia bacterium]|nr:V-type ATPase subunit [Clostridia bacterium]